MGSGESVVKIQRFTRHGQMAVVNSAVIVLLGLPNSSLKSRVRRGRTGGDASVIRAPGAEDITGAVHVDEDAPGVGRVTAPAGSIVGSAPEGRDATGSALPAAWSSWPVPVDAWHAGAVRPANWSSWPALGAAWPADWSAWPVVESAAGTAGLLAEVARYSAGAIAGAGGTLRA
jgi:hypothetical protein